MSSNKFKQFHAEINKARKLIGLPLYHSPVFCVHSSSELQTKLAAYKQRHPHENNKIKNTKCKLKRTLAEYNASPVWLNKETITSLKDVRLAFTNDLTNPLSLDHVIPLRGELVAGLHEPRNWELMPKLDNQDKGNAYDVV